MAWRKSKRMEEDLNRRIRSFWNEPQTGSTYAPNWPTDRTVPAREWSEETARKALAIAQEILRYEFNGGKIRDVDVGPWVYAMALHRVAERRLGNLLGPDWKSKEHGL